MNISIHSPCIVRHGMLNRCCFDQQFLLELNIFNSLHNEHDFIIPKSFGKTMNSFINDVRKKLCKDQFLNTMNDGLTVGLKEMKVKYNWH